MTPTKVILKETKPNTHIRHLVEALRTFRTTFLEKTSVKGKCRLPEKLEQLFGPAWSGYGNIEISCCGTSVLPDSSYECIFRKPDGSWARRNLHDIVTLEDYEQLIFSFWSYTEGQALDAGGEDEHCVMNWVVKLEAVSTLESMAQDIDRLLIPLSSIDSCKGYVKKIYKILRNGNSKWMPDRVHWTYIKELDELIKELELARAQNSADIEQKEISDQSPITVPYEH